MYKISKIDKLLNNNEYVGRGIIVGKTKDSKKAVLVYFIMGRSKNSRNRIFELSEGILYTKPFDEKQVEDPSLIIYRALREYNDSIILTNGDQTDTIYEGLMNNKSFSEALETRSFEPDYPNFTPRISAILNFEKNNFKYQMSILKSANKKGEATNRFTYSFEPLSGVGHFIHTYVKNGNPLPTFNKEPERIEINDNIEDFTNKIWNSLNTENKISLYVRYIDIKTKEFEDKLINKNTRG